MNKPASTNRPNPVTSGSITVTLLLKTLLRLVKQANSVHRPSLLIAPPPVSHD